MRLREKGGKDGEVITLGWDEAQAALQAGTHEVVNDAADGGVLSGESGPDADDAEVDLDGKTRAELDAIAAERGVDVSAARTKADVIEALRAPR